MKGCAQWGSTAFRHSSVALMQFSECEFLCRQVCSAHVLAELTHGRTIHEIYIKQSKSHSYFQKTIESTVYD